MRITKEDRLIYVNLYNSARLQHPTARKNSRFASRCRSLYRISLSSRFIFTQHSCAFPSHGVTALHAALQNRLPCSRNRVRRNPSKSEMENSARSICSSACLRARTHPSGERSTQIRCNFTPRPHPLFGCQQRSRRTKAPPLGEALVSTLEMLFMLSQPAPQPAGRWRRTFPSVRGR
jgi:hypothetical protein